MSKLRRLAVIMTAVFALAVPAMVAATPAMANGTGYQVCDSGGWCFNAKSYGPSVDAWGYCQASGCSANDFTWINNYNECNGGYTTSTCPGNGIPAGWAIGAWMFTGGGAYNGKCIGDAFNLSNRADAYLVDCPSGSNNGGWGVNMVYLVSPGNTCGSGWVIMYDIHWGGYVRWAGNSNGSTVYLNNSNGYCLHLLSPA